jgi:serine/threonine protein kinase
MIGPLDAHSKKKKLKPMDAYEFHDQLGEGTFGTVRLAIRKSDLRRYAVKFSPIARDEGIPATAMREISNLRIIQSPYVVGLCDVLMTDDHIAVVMDFCDVNLREFITSSNNSRIPGPLVVKFTRQLTSGLNHCHSNRIIHRDIKPQNILVDRANEIVRLADFGLTRQTLMDKETPLTPEVVTLWYRSPELLLSRSYSWSVDVWSLGCVVGEMAGGRAMFRGDSEIGVIFEIFKYASSALPHTHTWPSVPSARFSQVAGYARRGLSSAQHEGFLPLVAEMDYAGSECKVRGAHWRQGGRPIDPYARLRRACAHRHAHRAEPPLPIRGARIATATIGEVESRQERPASCTLAQPIPGTHFSKLRRRPLQWNTATR